MATYKELHGIAVQDVSSDSTAAGEIFYNSSTNTFRSVVQTEAWRSQSPLSEGRSLAGTVGTAPFVFLVRLTSALCFLYNFLKADFAVSNTSFDISNFFIMIFLLYRLFHHKVSRQKTSDCVPARVVSLGTPQGHHRDTIKID